MIDNIESPAAIAYITWLAAEDGGRRTGPPTVPVYAANCSFPLGGEAETLPGWPVSAEKFSVFIQKVDDGPDGAWICKIDFIAPGLVAAYLSRDADMLVMEGPKIVGRATISDVFEPGDQADPTP
jgi:hypothetical protein